MGYHGSVLQLIILIILLNLLKFILIVAASSVGEELFYRAAVQGALADVFVRGNDLVANAHGMAALVQLQTALTLILFSTSDKMGGSGRLWHRLFMVDPKHLPERLRSNNNSVSNIDS